jgi:serine/threonine-protein kinase HipA
MALETLHVSCCFNGKAIPVGRLAYVNRKVIFEYSNEFLDYNLEIFPFKLPLKNGLFTCDTQASKGLFGVFNDSLPNGWGRLLLDRKLMNLGINPTSMTPLDRLKYVGKRGMGALQYLPEFPEYLNIIKHIG